MRLAAYKQLLRYSLFAFIINIISFLLSRFDYFLVRRFCRESDLGNYILANKMAQLFYLFPAILASVFFNYTAKGGENGTAYSVARTSRILSLGYVALFLILFACNELFTLVFGESFDKTHSLVVLMMPGILLFGIGHLLTAYLSGKNRLSAIFISTLIALIALIILDIIFIPLYGVYAASVVTSIAYILLFFLLAYFLRKYDDISFVKLLILNKDDWQYVKDLFTRLISKK
jgi:O-antigen/teichoic acid export membrane protein